MGASFGGAKKFLGVAAAAMLAVALGAANSSAGDVTASPADGLDITNSSTKLLPDGQASESSWLSGFHMSGYATQTFGMWQDPSSTHAWTRSSNQLAVSRTLLQVDENYRLNENNTFFAREWFVYEPVYAYNSSNNTNISAIDNAFLSPFCGKTGTPSSDRCKIGRETATSPGHFYNDIYNNYQVRDAWWENKTGPLTTFVGNQIVVWGQSLAFRIGDVINPQDLLWNFGFANLEQSRNAQWMVHPILNLPEWGPLQSNFLELVIEPGFQPQWWENSFGDGRNNGPGADTKAGRYATYAPHGNPSLRFDIGYDHAFDPSMNVTTGPGPWNGIATPFYSAGNNTMPWKPIGYVNCGNHPTPFSPHGGNCLVSGSIVGPPLQHIFWECLSGAPGTYAKTNPLPAGLRKAPFGPGGCNLTLSHNNLSFGAAGDYALWDTGPYHIPGMQPSNWNDGARFHTLIGSTELTALYYNDNLNGGFPAFRFGGNGLPYYTNLDQIYFPDIQIVGVTADRPLPVPASVSEFLPIVGRAEVTYTNHEQFYDSRPTAFSGVRYSDVVKEMVALDIDQAYAPWLTKTGNLTAFFEVFDDITMDNSKLTPVTALDSKRNDKNEVYALASIGTGYYNEDIEPTWTMIYQPKGTTFALFPTLVLNPPWTKKYFVKLQAIDVFGSDPLHGLGLFKGQNLLTAQFQYNFNVL
ncbi:MAG TPA: hypothetical protein VKS22_14115 [Candidatus Binataceae bacterium]|nr:hypothetical protein [Candidatus Binataceae bacterium]